MKSSHGLPITGQGKIDVSVCLFFDLKGPSTGMLQLETGIWSVDRACATKRRYWCWQDGERSNITPVVMRNLFTKLKSLTDTCPDSTCLDCSLWLQVPERSLDAGPRSWAGPATLSNISSATSAQTSFCGWHATPGTELSCIAPNNVNNYTLCSQHKINRNEMFWVDIKCSTNVLPNICRFCSFPCQYISLVVPYFMSFIDDYHIFV